MSHSPLPWKTEVLADSLRVVVDRGAGEFTDDVCVLGDCRREDNQGNAAFIVRACNAHGALVAALRSLSDRKMLDRFEDREVRAMVAEFAEEVLSKTEAA